MSDGARPPVVQPPPFQESVRVRISVIGAGDASPPEIGLAKKMGREVALLGRLPYDLPLPRMKTGEAAAEWALNQAGRGGRYGREGR